MGRLKTTYERFGEKFSINDDTGCWEWLGSENAQGYGRFKFCGKLVAAHRWSAQYLGGMKVAGRLVCHTCDKPYCVNPKHLFVGDPKDNMRDMKDKGRDNYDYGERHHASKLTDDIVLDMRASYAQGDITYKELANKHGVSISTVSQAIKRKTWRHL